MRLPNRHRNARQVLSIIAASTLPAHATSALAGDDAGAPPPDTPPAGVAKPSGAPTETKTLPVSSDTPSSEENEAALGQLSLAELLNIKLTIASLTEDPLLHAPSTVTTFNQQEIRNLGVQTVGDLLNYVPGFQSMRELSLGDTYRISVRGHGKPQSEHVLILINGQRINDPQFGGAPVTYRQLPVENVDRVEIIRGPGSALYGSSAFLGVVNIITKTRNNDASLALGSHYARMASANIAGEAGPASMSAFVRTYADEGQLYENLSDQFGRTGSTRDAKYGYDISATAQVGKLTLNVRRGDRHFRDFVPFGTLQNRSAFDYSSHDAAAARYDLELSPDVRLSLSAGVMRNQFYFTTTIVPAGTLIGPNGALGEPIREGPVVRDYDFTSNVDLIWQTHPTNQLLTGLSYGQAALIKAQDSKDHDPATLEYSGDVLPRGEFSRRTTRHILGAYVSDKQRIGDIVNLIGGARFDTYDDFGSSFNPRVAAVVKGPAHASLRTSFATAFRAPTFAELWERVNPVHFGNPNLTAEKIRTFEVGYSQWSRYITGMVTYFHNTITDAMLLSNIRPVDPVNNPLEAPVYVNSPGSTMTQGLEFEVFLAPLQGATVRGTYSHIFDTEGSTMPGDFGSFIVNQRLGPVNVNLNGIYRRKMDLLPTQKDYVVLNTNVLLDVTKNWRLRLSGYNLLDTDYRTYTQVLRLGVPNRGITVLGGVTYEL